MEYRILAVSAVNTTKVPLVETMKILATAIIVTLLWMIFLHTDFAPWQIVSRGEIDNLHQQLEEKTAAVATVADAAAATPPQHTGAWMYEPGYRSALEKTTVVGRPEAAKHRDE